MNSDLGVRLFEILSVSLFLVGLYWVIRQKNPFYLGAYLGSAFAGVYFDWINNLNWLLRVVYDSRFIPLFYLDGYPQPLAFSANYAFYFGIPILLMLHYRNQLAQRLGERGLYIFVTVFGGLASPAFEIPMIQLLKLWRYYQRDEFLLGGVPWTNIIYSGVLFLLIFAALNYARQRLLPNPDGAVNRAERIKAIVVGFAALTTAFALGQFIQMFIYAATTPWIPSPRPF
jgi:hypothetical protein